MCLLDQNCHELVSALSGIGRCFKQAFPLMVAFGVSLKIPVHISIPNCRSVLTNDSLHGSNCISVSALSLTASSSTLRKAGSILFPLRFRFSFQVVLLDGTFFHTWLTSDPWKRELPHKLICSYPALMAWDLSLSALTEAEPKPSGTRIT